MTVNHPAPDEAQDFVNNALWEIGAWDDLSHNQHAQLAKRVRALLSTHRIKILEEALAAGPQSHGTSGDSGGYVLGFNQANNQWRSKIKVLMRKAS